MRICVKSWDDFQHYKHRSPPWIRLHRSLLDNYEFQCLQVASRALAPMLWLLASESKDGSIDASPKKLAFRLRMTEKEVSEALTPLIDRGFFLVIEGASDVLAECVQDADTEKSRDRVETEESIDAQTTALATTTKTAQRKTRLPEDFYPNETGEAIVEKNKLNLAMELQKFRDYHQAKGTTMLDWQAAWRTWVWNAVKFSRSNGNAANGWRDKEQERSDILTGRATPRREIDITPVAGGFTHVA